MKKVFLIILCSMGLLSVANAKTEKLRVIKVMDIDDKAILEDHWDDKWLVELGIGCHLDRYEGREVVGEYGIDLDSPGAKLILPDGDECHVWNAEKLN